LKSTDIPKITPNMGDIFMQKKELTQVVLLESVFAFVNLVY